MTAKITKLKSGFRVITDSISTVDSVAIGVWADVGTRNEDLSANGVAHMVEHMMFNGTEKRSAQDIVKEVENVGGQMNAYTSRENTAYYVHLLKEDTELAIDVLSDMIQHSVFPDKEIEKERQVIIQEIGMTNDTPDDIVFDYYQETAYPDQSLGAPILGTADIIQSMGKTTLSDYVSRLYTSENLVLSAAGNCDHDQIVAWAQQYFASLLPANDTSLQQAKYKGGYRYETKDLEQAHVVLGFQGIEKTNPNYYTAVLLSTLLGGGMSSRLFQNVREKHGLAYSVYSSHSAFKDDGQFEIYAGTGPNQVTKLIPVVIDELHKIMEKDCTETELERAKAQLKSSIVMGQESMLSRANRQAKYLMNFDKAVDINQLIALIRQTSMQDVEAMAKQIFSATPTVSILGPNASVPTYDDIQEKLAA
ncbi:MAG: pitrilysin family protein [Pseudomonadota bacterium]